MFGNGAPRVHQLDMTDLSATEAEARDLFISHYNVSRETLLAFDAFGMLLQKWAKQINLVGPSTIAHFWQRHVLDCAQLLPVISGNAGSVVDIGSGAGLPGLVLAKLLHDLNADSRVTLVESSAKRCGFLREAARTLAVPVEIVQQPIENFDAFKVDVVTARAFAPLEKLLRLSHPWAEKGARLVFLKGEDVQSEIDWASTKWAFQSSITQSLTDSRGCILEVSNLRSLKGI